LAAVSALSTTERLASARAAAEAAQRQAAEHQLRLLQSQLEPHMLFNTLANLRVLIALDPPRAQAMLDRLIAFLRSTLQASRAGTHTLADEFARLDDYLGLMAVRRVQARCIASARRDESGKVFLTLRGRGPRRSPRAGSTRTCSRACSRRGSRRRCRRVGRLDDRSQKSWVTCSGASQLFGAAT
jgi:hypothetical protein